MVHDLQLTDRAGMRNFVTQHYAISVYSRLHSTYRKLPPSWRTGLKRAIGAHGHGKSAFDLITARKDATGKKRLDVALEGLLGTLGPDAGKLLKNKVCIDFGAGYVPADGVAMWLLGAAVVYGVDYNDIAKRGEIARAVRSANRGRIERQLELLEADRGWDERLDKLRRWAVDHREQFPPGYSYLAPMDVIASPSLLPKFDILVSTSVLEHIRPSNMVALLDALKSRENDGAMQFHRVDLRDHRDFENCPYGFLDQTDPFDAEMEADTRGNGMTFDDWQALVAENPGWEFFVREFQIGRPLLLPETAPRQTIVADWLVLRTMAG